MPLINSEINLILTWSKNCVISSANGAMKFIITDTKLYVLGATLWTQDDIKPLKQLESSFKRIINWNKYKSKLTEQTQNRYLDYLIDPSFQGVIRLFVLSSENRADREVQTWYFFPNVEIKDYNFMFDGKNFFDQQVKNDLRTYGNIWKIFNKALPKRPTWVNVESLVFVKALSYH